MLLCWVLLLHASEPRIESSFWSLLQLYLCVDTNIWTLAPFTFLFLHDFGWLVALSHQRGRLLLLVNGSSLSIVIHLLQVFSRWIFYLFVLNECGHHSLLHRENAQQLKIHYRHPYGLLFPTRFSFPVDCHFSLSLAKRGRLHLKLGENVTS